MNAYRYITLAVSICLSANQGIAQVCPPNGFSSIEVINVNDSGPGSLRQAIICANANASLDDILFNISGAGPHFISLETELPPITDESVVLDATTQPGWQLGSVVINGGGLAGSDQDGLTISADNVEIYGLWVEAFSQSAINFSDGAVRTNLKIGAVDKGNVLSCNTSGQVIISGLFPGQGGTGNVISHNYIGTSPSDEVLGGLYGISCTRNALEITNNVFAYITRSAILVDGESTAYISNNSLYCNGEIGISGNPQMRLFSPTPTIEDATPDGVYGNTGLARNAIVEVYEVGNFCNECLNGATQGNLLIGTTTSDNDGQWALLPTDFINTPAFGRNVVATSTASNATSEYAECFPVALGACEMDTEVPVIDSLDLDGDGLFGEEIILTNTNICQADFLIPEPTITDNCDDDPNVSARIYYGPDFTAFIGPFAPGAIAPALPIGDHRLEIRATDESGNVGGLNVPLLVRDTIRPVVLTNLPDTVTLFANEDCLADLTFQLSVLDNCTENTRTYFTWLRFYPPSIPFVIVGDTLSGPGILNIDTTITLRDNYVGEYELIIEAQDVNLNYNIIDQSPVFVRIIPGSVPTPLCPVPTSVALMPDGGDGCTGTANLEVLDYVIRDTSECGGPLRYAIYRETETTEDGFTPELADSSLTLSCSDVGSLALRVYAVDTFGVSNFCNISLNVNPGEGCPPPVPDLDLRCGATTTSSITFNWSTDLNLASYEYRLNGSTFPTTTTEDFLEVTGLSPGETAEIIVEVITPDGCGQTADTLVCSADFLPPINYSIELPEDLQLGCGTFSMADVAVDVTSATNCGTVPFATIVAVDTIERQSAACYTLAVTIDVVNSCEYRGGGAPLLISRDPDGDGVVGESGTRITVNAGIDNIDPADDRAFVSANGDAGLPGTELSGYATNAGRGYFRYVLHAVAGTEEPLVVDATINLGAHVADEQSCSATIDFDILISGSCTSRALEEISLSLDLDPTDVNNDGTVDFQDFEADDLMGLGIAVSLGVIGEDRRTANLSNLPLGDHLLGVSTVNDCGEESTNYFLFQVIDGGATTPVCNAGVTVPLTSADGGCNDAVGTLGSTQISASALTDCSGITGMAVYSQAEAEADGFNPVIGHEASFRCGDGDNATVFLYAFDGAGNTSLCTTTVSLRPADGISCVGPPDLTPVETNVQCSAAGGFDLTLVDESLTQGAAGYTVAWFEDAALGQPIASPTFFAPAAAPFIAYARATNGSCFSNILPVTFAAEDDLPITFSTLPAELCANGGAYRMPLPDQDVPGSWTIPGTGIVQEIDPTGRAGETIELLYFPDPGFCVSDFAATITVIPSPVATFTNPADTICRDSVIRLTYAGADAGAMEFFWSSVPNGVISNANEASTDFLWTNDGPVTVSLSVSRNGCLSEAFTRTYEVAECPPCNSVIDCVPQTGQIGSVVILDTLTTSTVVPVCLPVFADGFQEVVGFGFSVGWDPSVLMYQGLTDVSPLISGFTELSGPFVMGENGINTNNATVGGTLTALWEGFTAGEDCTQAPSFSLPDGEVIFRVCFEVENAGDGAVTDIDFIESPQEAFMLTVNNCTGPGPGTLAGFGAKMNFSLACDHPDFPALAALYNSTNGDDWTRADGWNPDPENDACTPCEWFGITCDDNDRVIIIELDSNNLTGSLPAELGELIALREIDLRDNEIGGRIPFAFGTLSLLEFIDLDMNELEGEVPPGVWSMRNLRELELWANRLEGEIPDLSQMVALEYIDLDNNGFSGDLPASLGTLPLINEIDLADNEFAGEIPASYGSFITSVTIDLSDNPLLGGCIPGSFQNYCDDADIDLTGNPLLPYEGDFNEWCGAGNLVSVSAFCNNGFGVANDTIDVDCNCVEAEMINCDDTDIIYILDTDGDIQPTCENPNGGQISGFAAGGTGPYTYLWSNGDTTMNITGLAEGDYNVTVTDANGCVNTTMVLGLSREIVPPVLTCPEPLTGTLPANIDSLLFNVSAPGAEGCPLEGLTYSISGATTASGNGVVGPRFFNVGVSEITYKLGESTCTTLVTIDQLSADCNALSLTNLETMSPNCDNADGSIGFNLTGGSGDYGFSWSSGDTELNPTDLTAGIYILRIIDNMTECSFALGIQLQESSPAMITCSAEAASGEDATDGLVRIDIDTNTVTLPVGLSFTGSLSGSFTVRDAVNGLVTITDLPPGAYELNLTDANGCEAFCAVEVGFASCEELILGTVLDTTICAGQALRWGQNDYTETGSFTDTLRTVAGCDSVVFLTLAVEDGTGISLLGDRTVCDGGTTQIAANGAETYRWRGDNGFEVEGSIVTLPAGPYEMEATTATGCVFPFSLEVTNAESPNIAFLDAPNFSLCPDNSTVLRLDLGADQRVEWRLDPDALVVGRADSLSVPGPGAGYQVVVFDTLTGCISDTAIFIDVRDEVPSFTYCPPDREVLLDLGERTSVDLTWRAPEAVTSCGEVLDLAVDTTLTGLSRDTVITYTTQAGDGATALCSFSIDVIRTDTMTFYVERDSIVLLGEDTLLVPIGVINFDRGAAFQLHLTLEDMTGNGTLMETVTPLHPLLETGLSSARPGDRQLNLLWLTDDPQANSFPDSTLLLSVMVVVSGEPGACTRLGFADELPEVAMAFREGEEVFPSTRGAEVCLPALADISGTIRRYIPDLSLRPVPNVEVSLSGEEPLSTLVTDGDGSYFFPERQRGNAFQITPFLDGDDLNGVSILDVVLIQNMAIGRINLSSPTSPYQYIAADLQGDDCVIGIFDLFIVLRTLSGTLEAFPTVNSYRFVDASYQLPTVDEIRAGNTDWCAFPQAITIEPLNEDSLNNDFIAVKMGDVSLSSRDPRPQGGRTISFYDQSFLRGDTITVDLIFSPDLVAADMRWELTSGVLRPIADQKAAKEVFTASDFIHAEGRRLHQVWSELTGPARLKFVASASGSLRDHLMLLPRAVGADEEGRTFWLKPADFPAGVESTPGFRVSLYPNPFRDQINVTISRDEPGRSTLQLSVFDANGKRLTNQSLVTNKGINNFSLPADFGPSGLYQVRVKGAAGERWLRIIKQ